MRRMNHLARDYATKRSAFGAELHKQPAHVSVLARMEIESRAAMLLGSGLNQELQNSDHCK